MELAAQRESVLVIAPHPDDESFGCGGTVKQLTLAGLVVDAVFMTRGELGSELRNTIDEPMSRQIAEVRSREAFEACLQLGVAQMWFLDGRDGSVSQQSHLAGSLAQLLGQKAYSRVFCPWPGDQHPDHQATFHWLRAAVSELAAPPDAWLYEVWTPLRPNTFVPIDHTLESKCRAIDCHQSQLRLHSYKAAFLGLAAYRALFCPQSQAAEAFYVCEGSLFARRDYSIPMH